MRVETKSRTLSWRAWSGVVLAAAAFATAPVLADQHSPPTLMSAAWAEGACAAWNEDPVLIEELAPPGWAANDADRGFKVLQLYRSDCADSPRVELRISGQDDQARCTYGGAVETAELVSGVDYVMSATTERWQQMGAGDYGPMKAMMFGRLKFKGPKFEAMRNMGPFGGFLRLVGAVPGDVSGCPTLMDEVEEAPADNATEATEATDEASPPPDDGGETGG